MQINQAQAKLLLDWMAIAAEDAATDETEGVIWRMREFRLRAKDLMEQFNELEDYKEPQT